jgi:NitT/TauT family transport system permease protein
MTRARAIFWTRIAVIAASVALVEILCRTGIIKNLVMIPPSAMAASMAHLLASGEITEDIARTFSTVGLAFTTAVTAGFSFGVLVHAIPRLRQAIDPLLASYYSVPFFVFYPLLVALFGLSTLPLMVIGFLFAVPAMMIATLLGLDRVPLVLLKVARMHRLSRTRTALLIVLPAALPSLMNGIKLSLAYAFIGVIAGEFILSGGGLGYSIAYAYESFENRTMYGLMLFVLLTAIVLNGALHMWETRLNRRRRGT